MPFTRLIRGEEERADAFGGVLFVVPLLLMVPPGVVANVVVNVVITGVVVVVIGVVAVDKVLDVGLLA